MATFFLAFTLQCLFPIFELPGEFLGISLVNVEAQEREFTVTVTSSDGADVRSGRLTIPAFAQRARLVREILAITVEPANGWVRVDSAAPSCTGLLSSGDERSLQGTEPASTLATTVLLPHVEVNTGFMELNHTETSVAIVNPNAAVANVNASLFGLNGVVRGNAPLQIPARGSLTFRVSAVFNGVLPANGVGGKAFEGYLRLTSNIGVAAWQRIDTPLATSVLRGRAPTELNATTLATFPHFVFDGNYGSFLNLVNPTNAPLALELSAHDDRGNMIGESIQLTLAPGEARRSSVGEFFRVVIPAIFPPPTITGYIRIRETRGQTFQIAGDVEILRTTQGAPYSSMMVWISDLASLSWTLPFALGTPPYFAGYVVLNPNELLAVQTDVTIEFVGPDGTVLDRSTLSLSPRNRRASLISEGLATGYLRIRANLPVYALGSIGTRDGAMLDQLPALR